MERPYFRSSIAELEKVFESSERNVAVLKALFGELEHRCSYRAMELQAKVKNVLTSPSGIGRDSGLQEPPASESLIENIVAKDLGSRRSEPVNEKLVEPNPAQSSSPKSSDDSRLSFSQYNFVDFKARAEESLATDKIVTSHWETRANGTQSSNLLQKLLAYIEEQAKAIDPLAYRLSNLKGFLRRPEEVTGLPSVEFDLKLEGDHVWLKIGRIKPTSPPVLAQKQKGLCRVNQDPDGPAPAVDEAAFQHWLNEISKGKSPDERNTLEKDERVRIAKELHDYTILWKSWAEGERPRRKTISLYGDLFA